MSSMRRQAWIALLVVTALGGVQMLVYYPQLPDTVASHFSAAGAPDGYSSKQSFLTMALVLVGGVLLLFAALGWLLRVLPPSLINMPNREYWLAPERRLATVAELSRALLWFGAVTRAFVIGILELTVRANLDELTGLPTWAFWGLLGGYLAYSLGWLIWLILRFAKTGQA